MRSLGQSSSGSARRGMQLIVAMLLLSATGTFALRGAGFTEDEAAMRREDFKNMLEGGDSAGFEGDQVADGSPTAFGRRSIRRLLAKKRPMPVATQHRAAYTAMDDCDPTGKPDKCEYVKYVEECTSDDGLIQYLPAYHCGWAGKFPTSAFFVFWMCVLFYTLAQVADKFLCPSLEKISDLLRLPPDLAGVTLLAFANGAPDVFTEMAAVTGGHHVDLHLAVSSTVGAGMYISAVVLAVVIIIRPQAVEDRIALQREAWSYFFGMVVLLVVIMDSVITLVEVGGLLAYYAVYIAATVVSSRMINAKKLAEMDRKREMGMLSPAKGRSPRGVASPLSAPHPAAAAAAAAAAAGEPPKKSGWGWFGGGGSAAPAATGAEAAGGAKGGEQVLELIMPEETPGRDEDLPEAGSAEWLWQEIGWDGGAPAWRKAAVLVTAPIDLMMHATMPEVKEGQGYNRMYMSALCVGAPAFVLYAMGVTPHEVGSHTYAYLALGSAALAYVIHHSSLKGGETTDTPVMAVVAFVMSILWMDVVASELVALFHAVGHIAELSQDFLGATVLAWGESVSDLVANISVARSGRGSMAVAACFGGPLFNTLVGMGAALGYQVASSGPVEAELSSAMVVLFVFCMAGIVLVAVGVPLIWKWEMNRRLGLALLALYGLFNVTFVLTESGVLFAGFQKKS